MCHRVHAEVKYNLWEQNLFFHRSLGMEHMSFRGFFTSERAPLNNWPARDTFAKVPQESQVWHNARLPVQEAQVSALPVWSQPGLREKLQAIPGSIVRPGIQEQTSSPGKCDKQRD